MEVNQQDQQLRNPKHSYNNNECNICIGPCIDLHALAPNKQGVDPSGGLQSSSNDQYYSKYRLSSLEAYPTNSNHEAAVGMDLSLLNYQDDSQFSQPDVKRFQEQDVPAGSHPLLQNQSPKPLNRSLKNSNSRRELPIDEALHTTRKSQIPDSFEIPSWDQIIRESTHKAIDMKLILPPNDASYHIVRRFLCHVLTIDEWGISKPNPGAIKATIQNWHGTGYYLRYLYEQEDLGDICPPAMPQDPSSLSDPLRIPNHVRDLIANCVYQEIRKLIDREEGSGSPKLPIRIESRLPTTAAGSHAIQIRTAQASTVQGVNVRKPENEGERTDRGKFVRSPSIRAQIPEEGSIQNGQIYRGKTLKWMQDAPGERDAQKRARAQKGNPDETPKQVYHQPSSGSGKLQPRSLPKPPEFNSNPKKVDRVNVLKGKYNLSVKNFFSNFSGSKTHLPIQPTKAPETYPIKAIRFENSTDANKPTIIERLKDISIHESSADGERSQRVRKKITVLLNDDSQSAHSSEQSIAAMLKRIRRSLSRELDHPISRSGTRKPMDVRIVSSATPVGMLNPVQTPIPSQVDSDETKAGGKREVGSDDPSQREKMESIRNTHYDSASEELQPVSAITASDRDPAAETKLKSGREGSCTERFKYQLGNI
ncbi:uncharacterized protein BDR25DRAFT_374391 [Lindgomyces ingoldianus]|uniref:Uncharacterized protein n=1 Tax=Lindgomyces ingoldianus TaxID=673940 RepID=A0ACB6QKZ3_9PLEO|nr:uncharacterized protein BDR25DRAFT_374391 [Lindgomyces ingoldianus]KAF2467613.1 hypothetical protein BDR25DRAFT_374391 [Lindgomyces ingoldianus]